MSRVMPSAAIVSARRLSDTAVTPSRLLDRKRHDSRVRRIAADERDVGAVQRGDGPRRRPATPSAARIWPREIGRGRVRNGVMRVDDVEPLGRATRWTIVLASDEQVLRLAEQRIRRRLDPVERQAAADSRRQPERLVAADEMDLVAAARQRMRQLGRDDAAAADRGVADDPDVHEPCFSRRRPHQRFAARRSLRRSGRRRSAPNCASRLSISCRNIGAVSRVATAPSSVGVNWLRVAGQRLRACARSESDTSTTNDGGAQSLMK